MMLPYLLEAKGVDAGYRERPVLRGISLRVEQGERLLLIGPNGCGKTTLLKVLAGALSPRSGSILFRGQNVTRSPAHIRVRSGLGFLMQTRNIFPSLTADENLQLGFWGRRREYRDRKKWLLTVFPMLRDSLSRRAGLLSGGERQALAIGMTLMRRVELLLLDEPTAGLSPKAAAAVLAAIDEAQQTAGFTSVIVEHNLRLVHDKVSRVVVMDQGRIVEGHGDPSIILNQKALQEHYFK